MSEINHAQILQDKIHSISFWLETNKKIIKAKKAELKKYNKMFSELEELNKTINNNDEVS